MGPFDFLHQNSNNPSKNNSEIIKSVYRSYPTFVKDALHLHFFKTDMYFDNRISGYSNLGISGPLNIMLFIVDYATEYEVNNGLFVFELKINSFGQSSRIPFPLLFNTLIKECYSSRDIENMYNRMYKSKNPILIRLAEQFKKQKIDFARLSSELFEFIKKKECNTIRIWNLNELSSGSWNFKLLALNNVVWETAFDIKYLSDIFKEEKEELDAIDEGSLYDDGYPNYLIRVDNLIHNKFK